MGHRGVGRGGAYRHPPPPLRFCRLAQCATRFPFLWAKVCILKVVRPCGLHRPLWGRALVPRACARLVSFAGGGPAAEMRPFGPLPSLLARARAAGTPAPLPAASGDPRPACSPPAGSFLSGAPPPIKKDPAPRLSDGAAALNGPWESGSLRGPCLHRGRGFYGHRPYAVTSRGGRFLFFLSSSCASPRPDASGGFIKRWLTSYRGRRFRSLASEQPRGPSLR